MSAAPLPLSLLPMTASIGSTGELLIGGVSLLDLVAEYGTPLFVYDEEHLHARCSEAVNAWGSGVAYATKAFLCSEMARLAHGHGMCLDVSTGGEMFVALRAGVPAGSLIFHGNNKSPQELAEAVRCGVGRIVVDSFDEIVRLDELTREGPRQDVSIRVTPGIEAHTHEFVRTGQADSKFGFGLESGQAGDAVTAVVSCSGLNLVGIHCHIGSQIFSTGSFSRALEVMAPFFVPLGLEELCLGGGLGVAYVEGEEAPTITEWAEVVRASAAGAGIPGEVRITAEPGRAIVAQAAITLYTVGTVKEIPGIRTYVAVDGGMSDNPRPVLYGSGYEVFLPREAEAERPRVADLVGKHCESGDFIVKDASVPADIRVGDVLATPVSGAYGYSMASNYNKVGRPPVLFVADGQARLVVRREGYDDLVRLDA